MHLKSVWKDGTRAIILEPDDLVTRLVAAVPPPCPDAADAASTTDGAGQGGQLELVFSAGPNAGKRDDDTRPSRKPWAWLLRHLFQADLEHCPRCDGPMLWVHAATAPMDIARLLAEHGLGPRPPPARSGSP